MTTKRKSLLIFGIILLFLILYAFLHQYQKNLSVKNNVTNVRSKALLVLDQKLIQEDNVLKQAGLINNQIAFSKVDVCYVTHEDGGWTIVSWYQDCYLRLVQGFTTSVSKSEALRAVSTLSKYFGEAQTAIYMQSEVNKCDLAEINYTESIEYRPINSPIDSNNYCGIPDQIQGVSSVIGPIMSDKELSIKKFSSFNPSTIDNATNQIWIMFDIDYYHQDLGCGLGIFCINPRGKPIQAP